MIASIILSAIAAVAAILAPLLTAIVNNRHNINVKKLDLGYSQKYQVYKNFSVAYGSIQFHVAYEDMHNFFAALYETMLLCDDKICTELNKLGQQLSSNNCVASEKTDEQFRKCCELLRLDLQREIQSKEHKR